MKFSDFVKEHVRLVKILKTGTTKQQKKEAADQSKELKKALLAHMKK
jgi:hypothetical protein